MADPHHSPEAGYDFAKDADSPGQLVLVYLVVIGLAAANVALSMTGLGRLALPVQLGIACVQAGFVAYFFMHLNKGDRVVILTALASIFWTGILFVLFLVDFATRKMLVG
jgi:cytochrome c oxidase subunit IV